MCLDEVVMAFYRRLFHPRPAADFDDQWKRRTGGSSVEEPEGDVEKDVDGSDGWKEVPEPVVVLDGDTFRQLMNDLGTLRMTVLQLQTALLEGSSLESQIGDNYSNIGNVAVPARCCYEEDGKMISALSSDDVCQENVHLRNRVDELERVILEKEKTINILKQSLAGLELGNMFPENGDATSDAGPLEPPVESKSCTTDQVVELLATNILLPDDTDASNANVLGSRTSLSPRHASSSGHTPNPQHHVTDTVPFSPENNGIRLGSLNDSSGFSDARLEAGYPTNTCGLNLYSSSNRVECGDVDDGQDVPWNNDDMDGSHFESKMSLTKHLHLVVVSGNDEEEEFPGDCSMFDYNCSAGSDHEFDFCETPDCVFGEATNANLICRNPLEEIFEKPVAETHWQDPFINSETKDVIRNVNEFTESTYDGSVGCDSSNMNVSSEFLCGNSFDGSLGENVSCDVGDLVPSSRPQFSLVKQGNDINRTVQFREVADSFSRQNSVHVIDYNKNLPTETLQSETEPSYEKKFELLSNNQTSRCQNIPQNIDSTREHSRLKCSNPEDVSLCSDVSVKKVQNYTQSNLRMPKSYNTSNRAIDEGNVISSGNCFSAVHVHDSSSLEAVNVSLSKSGASSCDDAKQLKETVSSRLPLLRFHKSSKLPSAK